MVTFRFYLVSIVAFFLALAVGVVLGSVLDGGISDSLKDRLGRVEANLNDTVAAIDIKNDEIKNLQGYVEASAPFAVEGQLLDTTAVIVVEPGVELGPVEDLVQRVRQSGASVAGVLALDPRWDLKDKADRAQFAQIADSADLSVVQLQRLAWSLILGQEVSGPPNSSSTTSSTTSTSTTAAPAGDVGTTPSSTNPNGTAPNETALPSRLAALSSNPVLKQLEEAGFLKLLSVDGTDGAGGKLSALFVVTGTESSLEQPGSAAGELADAASALEIPTVLAEVFVAGDQEEKNPAQRGDILRAALVGKDLGVSTVDDLDLIAGRVGSVLAAADLQRGISGNFGYGPGVDGVLPPWIGP